ncbi:glycosyltransferase [Sphingomonas sp.]|uniref:glycosyltransferase n=1 Tax=Sphingomonas sp. TaxID=28214 RepID=UPI002DD62831|nr:glycosyltransferase [Sphingomonas sp.]
MRNRLRIIVFVSSLSAGGAERVAVRLSEVFHQAEYDVCLLTLSGTEADFYQVAPGVTRIGLDRAGASGGLITAVRNNLGRLLAFRRAVTTYRPDVVLALADRSNVLMLLATIGMRCGKVISERSNPAAEWQPLTWRLLRRLAYPTAHLHVAQSGHVARWMADRFRGLRNVVIGNSAGPAVSDRRDRDEAAGRLVRLVSVGRLSREKGVDLLIDAFADVRLREAEVQLTIVGDGPERGNLEAQAHAMGQGQRVHFAGAVQDVFPALAEADGFVLPSRYEGFPNAMIEAMAVGLPVIVARCPGGTSDVLGEKLDRYGLEFSPGDAAGLVTAIDRFLRSPDLRRRLAAAALERSDDYSSEKIAAAWIEAIEGVARRSSAVKAE